MNEKTIEFLGLFNMIESALKDAAAREGKEIYMSFSKALNEVSKRDVYIKKNREILESIGSLRNVLVHEQGNVIMATPSDETIRILAAIVERYTKPPLVYELCREKVYCIKGQQTLKEALTIMEEKGYSKLPVYQNNRCVGLLTGNMIARWLRIHRESQEVIKELLHKTLIEDVLTYQKEKDQIRFIAKSVNVNEFMNIVKHQPSPSGVYLITPKGDDKERPIGIVTSYDFPRLY